MEFLVINKGVSPAKVSKVEAPSVAKLNEKCKAAGIEHFSAFLNISDQSLPELFAKVEALENRVGQLETAMPGPENSPAVFHIDESDNPEQLVAAPAPETSIPPPSKNVAVSLTKKQLRPANLDAGVYEPKLLFSIDIRNLTSKPIRAVKGDLVFSDLFQADIFRVAVTINNKIKPRGTTRWDGEMTYNEFIPEQVHFAGFAVEDLKVRLEDESVAYG